MVCGLLSGPNETSRYFVGWLPCGTRVSVPEYEPEAACPTVWRRRDAGILAGPIVASAEAPSNVRLGEGGVGFCAGATRIGFGEAVCMDTGVDETAVSTGFGAGAGTAVAAGTGVGVGVAGARLGSGAGCAFATVLAPDWSLT